MKFQYLSSESVLIQTYFLDRHCVQNYHIRSFSGPYFRIRTEYSARMRENADQKKSEYDHFSSNENLAHKLRHSLKIEKQINCSAVKFFVTDNLIMVNNSLFVQSQQYNTVWNLLSIKTVSSFSCLYY